MDMETGNFCDEFAVSGRAGGLWCCKRILQRAERVFPDGPVANTPCFPSGGAGSLPGLGAKIPYAQPPKITGKRGEDPRQSLCAGGSDTGRGMVSGAEFWRPLEPCPVG